MRIILDKSPAVIWPRLTLFKSNSWLFIRSFCSQDFSNGSIEYLPQYQDENPFLACSAKCGAEVIVKKKHLENGCGPV